MQDGDGFDLLEQCRRNWPGTQVILVTGYGTPDGAIEAIRAGAFDYVTKPLIDVELLMTIERALSQRTVLRENDNLREQLDRRYGMDNIVGRDPRMMKVFEMIASVAGMTNFSVWRARSMYSYSPLHVIVYPAGSVTSRSTIARASAT